jgi:ATP-binding cassette, subfamily F, member 3
MLEIDDLTVRMGARVLLDEAGARLADGWKVGLIGRNGTGKSTLLKLIQEEAVAGSSSIRLKSGARLGFVAQEIAPSDQPLIEVVLAADTERASLMAEAENPDTDPDRLGAVHERLADIDAWSAEARASSILVGLGFSQEALANPARTFSGGWRMRAALAGVLFAQPDLLILDEPTNYLDLEGAAWLEAFLRKYPNTVLLVSHDREMLNRCVTHILALDNRKLELHPGSYDTWMTKRAERASQAVKQKAKQDEARAHLQAFVDRFRAKASKARQAQSRIKMLQKMQEIAVPLEERTVPFRFPDPDELAAPLIELDSAALGYAAGRPVLRDVSFRLDGDDRIVVIGPNGEGKTTLVKSIAGKLALLSGQRRASRAVQVGYFSQDQLDELTAGDTVLQHVARLNPDWTPARQRGLAASFGFGAEKVDTKVENLSGGEKVRLILAMITYARPHVLILDEPTSHLDIDSREALVHAIHGYKGAVLLITHDVWLAEATAERLWLVKGGRARPYDGDLADYRALVLSAERSSSPPGGSWSQPADLAVSAFGGTVPEPARPSGTGKGPSPSTLRRRLAEAEAAMARLQAELDRIDDRLADPGLYSAGPKEAQRLSAERSHVVDQLSREEARWLEASDLLG